VLTLVENCVHTFFGRIAAKQDLSPGFSLRKENILFPPSSGIIIGSRKVPKVMAEAEGSGTNRRHFDQRSSRLKD
jgi:hypothetical protein